MPLTQAVRRAQFEDLYRPKRPAKLRAVLSPGDRLQQLANARGVSLADASRMIGRPPGFLARFVRDGVPSALRPLDLRHLSLFFDVEEVELGGESDRRTPEQGL